MSNELRDGRFSRCGCPERSRYMVLVGSTALLDWLMVLYLSGSVKPGVVSLPN